jgi:hypothetical protein
MMRRRLLIALLALGTVGGYASGIASAVYRYRHGYSGHRSGGCHRSWRQPPPPAPSLDTPGAQAPASPDAR